VFPLVSMANRENENDESQVSSPVSKEIVELAVELLLKVINSKPKDQKPQRVDRKEFICLVVQLKMRVDSTSTIPESIPVPHPLFRFDGSQAICLIIGDEIEGLNAEVAENKIKDEGLPISKVFQCEKLQADCKTFKFKDRNKLCQSFDLFMAYKSVVPIIPGLLWSTFPLNERYVVPVDLTHKQWRGELESACSLAIVSSKRSTCVAKVARVSQTSKEIVENVVAVIDRLVSVLPGKWNNISCMFLKTSDSLQCSLYTCLSKMPVGIENVETESEIDAPKMNGEAGIAGGLFSKKRIQHAEKTLDTKRKKGLSLEGKTECLNGQDVGDGVPKDDSPPTSGLEKNVESVDLQGGVVSSKKMIQRAEKTPDTKRKKGLSLEGKAGYLNGQDVGDGVPRDDSPPTSGLEKNVESVDLQSGVVSSKKRIQHAEKTPDTKRKKGLSLECKTGYLNGQDVGDGVPKDDSPQTSGLEKNVESVDLQGGVVANSVDASTKKNKSRSSKKTPVRVG